MNCTWSTQPARDQIPSSCQPWYHQPPPPRAPHWLPGALPTWGYSAPALLWSQEHVKTLGAAESSANCARVYHLALVACVDAPRMWRSSINWCCYVQNCFLLFLERDYRLLSFLYFHFPAFPSPHSYFLKVLLCYVYLGLRNIWS